jgi:hypothetical protein
LRNKYPLKKQKSATEWVALFCFLSTQYYFKIIGR